jgi:ABC-type dipeptide/oligopeptide/nickel transport system ATPase component
MPPDLIDERIGCPFAPRCTFAIERCLTEDPPLAPVPQPGPGLHEAACLVDVRRPAAELAGSAGTE